MKKLPASSRADLIDALHHGRLNAATAALYGFGADQESLPRGPLPEGWELDTSLRPPEAVPGPAVSPVPVFPQERPRLNFLRAEEAEALAPLPPPASRGNPVTDEELAVPWGREGLPLSPLIRWARLGGWLRTRLGAEVPGAAVDMRRLLRMVARREPVLVLPRRLRRIWSAQALILWDETREMEPFQPDLKWLHQRLERERGKHGLRVLRLRRLPHAGDLASLAPGAPVLAVSAMGQFTRDPFVMTAWMEIARLLRWRGHPLQALTPCPRRLWIAALTSAWPSAVWDGGTRLPRRGGTTQAPAVPEETAAQTKHLLDHLSPASRISPALLRAARLAMPQRMDAGVEWAAWNHPDLWSAPEACGFRAGEEYHARLARRAAFTGADAAAAERIAAFIREDHSAAMSAVIAFEAEVRAALSSPGAAPEVMTTLLERINDRLRRVLSSGGLSASTPSRIHDLPEWIQGMVRRLTRDMLDSGDLKKAFAECQALADTLQPREHTILPPGTDEAAYLHEIATQPPPSAAAVRLRCDLSGDGFDPAVARLTPAEGPARPQSVPLAFFHAAPGPLHLAHADGSQHRFQWESSTPPMLPNLIAPGPLTLRSTHQRLSFAAATRPPWAERMWYDRCGLAAQFSIGGVAFVLRWIPPGRFLMGSPPEEPGRFDNEGPHHEVTITRGFWMGETPVTRAQWRAVIEEAQKSSELKKLLRDEGNDDALKVDPSHFKGPAELPVESVNWHQSRRFCDLLKALMAVHGPDCPDFRLPSEAQWEYACRAGTDTALYSGGITLEGEVRAPELDPVAWYGGNSGQDLEVKNPQDSTPWLGKDGSKQAGTHRVKLKQPNAFGLYDTIGNVWEWCRDAWDERAYTKHPASDPEIANDDRGALRVLRGGSWSLHAQGCRASFRFRSHPGSRGIDAGLRLSAGQPPVQDKAAEPPAGAERLKGRRPRA